MIRPKIQNVATATQMTLPGQATQEVTSKWRTYMKNLMLKNGGQIRPILGQANGNSFVKQAMREIQAEVREQLKKEARQKEIESMTVEVVLEGQEYRVINGKNTYYVYRLGTSNSFDCTCTYARYNSTCKHVEAMERHIQKRLM